MPLEPDSGGAAPTRPPTPDTRAAATTESPLADPGRRLAVAAVLIAMTLVVMDAGMTNLALPTIAGALGVSPAAAVLVVTAYQTALLVALLPAAALGERLGYRPVFTSGVWLFIAASVLSACAPSLSWLVAARALQGMGGAAILALGVPLLRFSVPPQRLGAAIGWNALTVALASSAGPGVGALILSQAPWPWLYALNLPLGLAVLLACRWLPVTPSGSQRLDFASMTLSGGMFAGLFIGAQLLPARPLLAGGLAGGALVCLGLLVRREAPKAAPMVPLDLLRLSSLRLSVIASVLCFTGQTAAMVALPFYLQQVLGQSASATAVYMTVWPLSVAVTAIAAGRLADRVSTAWLCAGGGLILALGLIGAALWPLKEDVRPMLLFAAACGGGFGLFQTPNNRNMFLAAPLERSAASGGLQGTARLTGQTAGAVLMTSLFTLSPVGAAPRLGLGIGGALALLAGLVSLLRAREHPPATGDAAPMAS